MDKQGKLIRKFTGKVISNKMAKTVTVLVVRSKMHPRYHKLFKVSNKYKAHDEKNECQIGDLVIIEQCRPISKDKKWRVVKIVK
ncbi:MAG: 30S ribosomal protein S17 [Patescibacteria group bacterium]